MPNQRTQPPQRCDWCDEKPPRGTQLEPLRVVEGCDWICQPCKRRGVRRPTRKPTPKPTFGSGQLCFDFMRTH